MKKESIKRDRFTGIDKDVNTSKQSKGGKKSAAVVNKNTKERSVAGKTKKK